MTGPAPEREPVEPVTRPAPDAPLPNLPAGGPAIEASRRRSFGAAFAHGGGLYDAVRPGYPAEVVDFLLPAGARDAVDLGAGTGILSRELAARGLRTTAVDPSEDMLAQLRLKSSSITTVLATAEQTCLPAGSFDVATAAQSWHWVDVPAASAETARILRPGGRLALVWNQLDVTVPWVHRLSRIMHAGDVHRPGFVPEIGPEFTGWESRGLHWEQTVTPELLIELAKSRSYYLRAKAPIRARVEGNLDWYLHEHLGHEPGEELGLPYFTHAWRAHRR
ncbi:MULTISPECIES: class I SAM-dependent methyltransferase [unclassified Arthrobacter]|uniref:class I SAM-dependent methyltransferase n=1 Tax=unclassified Arthrobacter TaxID=235627 RepID=UPI002650C6DB|nr:methyltransferase domain-containing protein [Micrococcaceae bacterium]